MKTTQQRLFELQDKSYRDFQAALIPTIDPKKIIGIRIPVLRKFAKEIFGTSQAQAFLRALPHKYYDENNLHGFLIEQIRDFDQCAKSVDEFLPFIDNWATCDTLNPPAFKNHKTQLLKWTSKWLNAPPTDTYTVRFAIVMLMRHCLDENFSKTQMSKVAKIRADKSPDAYYIQMAQAWYIATALDKQYEAALAILERKQLDKWTHNKAIQKAIESRRIPPARKAYLKKLKLA